MAVAVVDAHHHLIDTHRLAYPWIEEPRPALTALLANYYDIAHDYDVQSYSADVDSERPAAAARLADRVDLVRRDRYGDGRSLTLL